MSRSKHCAWVIGLGIGLLISIGSESAQAQGTDPKGKSDRRDDGGGRRYTAPSTTGVTLPSEAALASRLEAAHDYIQEGAWAEAARALQGLLDLKEDSLVRVRRTETEPTRWTGVRTEAHRLVGSLAPNGREVYETIHEPSARALLTAAERQSDADLLEEVVRRYFHTASGGEATRLLALHYLDRGRFDLAALSFSKLLDRPDARQLPPATLLASVLAFRLAGKDDRALQVWNRLRGRLPKSGIRLGQRDIGLQDLENELVRIQSSATERAARAEWGLFRGDASRSGQGAGAAPLLEARWTEPTSREAEARQLIHEAVQEESRSQPVLSAAFPVAVGNKVIYRSFRGVHAVDRQTGKPIWEAASEWGFDRLVRDLRYRLYVSQWIISYNSSNPQLVFDNSTLGTLSTDGRRVYAVDDLAIPPYPFRYNSNGRRGGTVAETDFGPDLTEAANHSRLVAYDTESGKIVWKIGGQSDKGARTLADSYFLGPPLPIDDRLYGVIERDQELYLVCLDASRGSLLWSQVLAVPLQKIKEDVGRRVQAIPLAYADGILVCPTNAGAVLGIDLWRRSLAWAYIYAEEAALPQDFDLLNMGWGGRRGGMTRMLARVREDWKATAPVIHSGRVLVTAPDTVSLHCLDLRSGTLEWRTGRFDDNVYLAGVHDGKVVVVGRQNSRALSLADGKQLWTLNTGLPSGQGALVDKLYYLPVKSAMPEKQPAILTIDLDRGAVVGRTASSRNDVLGNLIFCAGDVLAQSVDAVMVFPRQKADDDWEK